MRVCVRDKEIEKPCSRYSAEEKNDMVRVCLCVREMQSASARVCEILCIQTWLRESERESHERAYVSERGRAAERERESA